MTLEEINKWLDNEYGVSYTRLEELHDFYFEKYCDLKKENQKLEKENFNLRENIYIEKMSFPNEGRNIKELIEMPTYEELQKENEKNKHYKTLYQSLKKQKEELRDWLKEGFSYDTGVVDEHFIEAIENVLNKMEELEGVNDEN